MSASTRPRCVQALSEQLIQSAGQIASLSPQAGLAALEMAGLARPTCRTVWRWPSASVKPRAFPDPHDPESAKAMQEQQVQQAQMQQQMQLELQRQASRDRREAGAGPKQPRHRLNMFEAQAIERKTAATGRPSPPRNWLR